MDKILIVDDIQMNINILEKLLSRYEFEVESCLSSEQALKVVESFRPDLILLDVNMPVIDGFECCRQIKAKYPEIFVIFVTALKGEQVRNRAFQVGGTDVMHKPFNLKMMVNKIQSTLSLKSQLDSKEEKLKEFEKNQDRYKESFDEFSKLKDIGSLTSTIAHDINNYLGGILGNLDLIEMTTGEEEILTYCGNIRTAVESTAELTQQLTSYSKKSSGEKKRFSIKDTLDHIIQLIERDVKYIINLTKSFNDGEYITEGSKSQLSAVFMNILKNACEAVGDEDGEGNIHVNLRQSYLKSKKTRHRELTPGTYAIISFEDDGCGIPRDMIEKIFEPFHTTKEKGTGLGMNSVIKYIDTHDGGVDIKSMVGEGTIITLYIPLDTDENKKALSDHNNQVTSMPLDAYNFLIVDDDEIFCKSVTTYIKLNKGTVNSFYDNSFAEYFKSDENLKGVDYFIVDYKVPFMDTFDAIDRIRSVNPDVKVIIISGGFVDISDIEGCFFLRKPISLGKIMTILQTPS